MKFHSRGAAVIAGLRAAGVYMLLLGAILSCGTLLAGCHATGTGSTDSVLPLPVSLSATQWKLKSLNRFKARGAIRAAPLVEEDIAYFGTLGGKFYALDLSSGRVLWKIGTSGAITGKPLRYGNNLIFLSGAGEEKLYCVTGGGKVAWKIRVGDSDCAPLRCDTTVVVATTTGDLISIDPDDSRILGEEWFGARINSMIGYDPGDRLFLTTIERKMYCVDGPKMEELWALSTEQIVTPPPALDVRRGQLIFADYGGMIYAVNTEIGAINWKTHVTDNCSSPLITDGRVFLISRGRELHVLDADSGNPEDLNLLEGMFRGPPVSYKGYLCLTSIKGDLVIMRHDGVLMGGGTISEVTYTTPLVDGDRILLGTDRGYLFTLSMITDS